MILEHNIPKPIERGSHVLVLNITSGTVELQISTEGSAFTTIDGTVFSATSTKYVPLPKGQVRALITGTAEVVLAKVEYT
jgi:hypothetical protein